MKFKLKDITKAMDYIKYNGNMDSTPDVDISIREEDFEISKVGSCMVFSVTCTKEPKQYERVKTAKTVVISVEVFPDTENRSPRVTMQESQDLEDER